MLTYLLAWFPMLFLAILNGTLREAVLKKWFSDFAAHQVSTFTLILFLALYIRFIVDHFPPATGAEAILIGLFWTVLTLGFEFGFGRYRGNSWSVLLADYNILKGHLWSLVPLSILVLPFLYFLLFAKK